jgi:hypothetical protein
MYGIFPLQEIKSKMNYTKISRQLDDALNQTRVTNVIGLTRNSHNKAARKVFFFFFYNSEFSYNTTTFILENHILVTYLCEFEIVKTVCLPFLRLTVNKTEI